MSAPVRLSKRSVSSLTPPLHLPQGFGSGQSQLQRHQSLKHQMSTIAILSVVSHSVMSQSMSTLRAPGMQGNSTGLQTVFLQSFGRSGQSQHSPPDLPELLPEDLPDEWPDLPELLPLDLPDELPDLPLDLPELLPLDLPPFVPPLRNQSQTQSDLPELLPLDLPDEWPDLPLDLPEDLPLEPPDLPELLPEDLPLDLPEHLPTWH